LAIVNTVPHSLWGEKVPFQPLFKNIGEKPAFYKNGFSATLLSIFKDSTSGSLGLGNMQHSK
jgi:hypothetical protein